MSLRPYKFIVQAVLQETDADGAVIGEPAAEPVTLFGCDALERWAREFPVLAASAERK